ncbi:hypothetical protein B0H13DRAFT_1902690 [Mycena leptocephala]|nr:hypothetical protein B0H13DRAFT_1902690 [Mycena leptocephala]
MAKSTSPANSQCFFGVPFFADASSTPSSNRVSATEPRIAPERAWLAPLARFRMLLGFWAVTATIRRSPARGRAISNLVAVSRSIVRKQESNLNAFIQRQRRIPSQWQWGAPFNQLAPLLSSAYSSLFVFVHRGRELAVAAASQIIAYRPSCKQTSRRAAEGPHDSRSREYSVKAAGLGNSGKFPELMGADLTTATVTLTSLPASHPKGSIIIRNVRGIACEGDYSSPEKRLNGRTAQGVGPNVDPETSNAFDFGRRFFCSAINHENAAGKSIPIAQIFSAQLLTHQRARGRLTF